MDMVAIEIATGWVDITPYHNGWNPQTRPYWHAGYGTENAESIRVAGVNNALLAKCLVLWPGGRPCVLVTLDLLGITTAMDGLIRNEVRKLGVADADFAMVASHTHSGPVLEDRPDPFITYWLDGGLTEVHKYTVWLIDTLAALVRQTVTEASRVPCRLDYGVGSATFAHNRYNEFSLSRALDMSAYLDPSVPVLTARSVDSGDVRAIIFGYACHAVARGNDPDFDSDYPGEAMRILENELYPDDVLTFFLPGAGGDNDPNGSRGPALVKELGRTLADAVNAVVTGDDRTPIDGTVRTALITVDLPLARTDTLPAMYAARFAANGDANKVGRHAHRMLDPANPNARAESVPLPVQMWTFGSDAALQLALCGGEVVSSYNHHFKTTLGWGDRFWLASYANQVQCYVVSDEQLANGGYEPGWHASEGPDVCWSGGSTLFYGWPCRFAGGVDREQGDGIEHRVIKAIGDLAQSHRQP